MSWKQALFVILASTLALGPSAGESEGSPATAEIVRQSVDKAVGFLAKRQYDFGSFPTDRCESTQMQGCIKRPILFIAANILVSLDSVDDKRVGQIKARAAKLFIEQQDRQGLWDFYVKKAQTPAYIREVDEFSTYYFPDLDDTALISYFLKTNGYPFRDNRPRFQANRERGLYLTFARETQPPAPHMGNIDPVVNAHVLMYLGSNDKKVCEFINEAVAKSLPSLYYQDLVLYYYLLARAYHKGVRCLALSAEPITRFLQTQRHGDGSFGSPLQTAAALNALMYFGHTAGLQQTIATLVRHQKSDGSWPTAFFFGGPELGYGSAELTTAVAAEALTNYQRSTVR